MQCRLLADLPSAIPLVARWYYEEWGRDLPDNSPEICAAWLAPQVNRERVPLHLIALEGDTVLGTAALKLREMTEFPDREHWLGGVFVPLEQRGRGVAAELTRFALEYAPRIGVRELFLQTDRLDGGLYARAGFEPLARVHSDGHEVLVMRATRLG